MSDTKSIIASPIKVMFTRDGVDYFAQRNKPLAKYRFADGSEEYGIHMTGIEPESLQRILTSGFVSKIEMAVDDLAAMQHHHIRAQAPDDRQIMADEGERQAKFGDQLFQKVQHLRL